MVAEYTPELLLKLMELSVTVCGVHPQPLLKGDGKRILVLIIY